MHDADHVGTPTRDFPRTAAAPPMSSPAVKRLLSVVEDNPGDVSLLRELFSEDDAQNTDVIRVERMRAAEYDLSEPVQRNAFDSLVKSIDDAWLTRARLPRSRPGG